MKEELFGVADRFCIEGTPTGVCPYGEGHINRTYLLTTTAKRYILQRMNTYVFPDPRGLMRNIVAVTEHLRTRGIETLNVIPTRAGEPFLFGGECWRIYDFIENSVTYQTAPEPRILRNAGYAFGQFQNFLAEFDASRLVEVIPHFHNTPKRYADFVRAAERDAASRAATCRAEIAFVHARKDTYSRAMDGLADGKLPLRVTHNDTKLNNVLMDAKTGEARAVIDLDTVMPGSLLFDFGDAIRFGAATAAEDEPDSGKMNFSLPAFRSYTEGYLSAVRKSITPLEAEMLPYGAYLMTVECGMRFLADYLDGDLYFATKYPEHNLVRARNQFRLAARMEEAMPHMHDVITSLL